MLARLENQDRDLSPAPGWQPEAVHAPIAAGRVTGLIQRSIGNHYLLRAAECQGPAQWAGQEPGCRGGCGGCGLSRMVQAKLRVGPAGDACEQEADTVAEQVASGPARVAARDPGVGVQRLPARPGGGPTDGNPPAGGILPATSGRPLPSAFRAFMESRFGQDFGDVRLHSDPDAHRLAGPLRARAFTHQQHIYLQRGENDHDHRLLAHELTHVVQQRGRTTPPVVQRAPDTRPAGAGQEPRAADFGSITMEFDGADLIVRGEGKEIFRYSAQSGRPVRLTEKDARDCAADQATDSYLNDKRFVGIENYGPIPEGTYTFSAQGIEKFDFWERLRLEAAGVVGKHETTVHNRPIHSGDWGTGRVALQPQGRLHPGPCGDVAKRSGFFLHGGILAGSSGCIDIGGHFDELAEFLAGYRRPVVVTVGYRHPPPSVGFFTGLSGAIAYSRLQLGHGPTLALGAEFSAVGARAEASVGYEFLLQWAGGALAAGGRLDIPFSDKEAFVRAGLTGGLDFRIFGPLYGRLRGGYSWDLTGAARVAGPEAGGGLRLDLNRYQIEAIYNVLRPAADNERVHQALVQLGFKF